MWRVIFLGIATLTTLSAAAFLTDEVKHLEICYFDSHLSNPDVRMAQSLDNLLAIIERVEQQPWFATRPLSEVAGYFVARYRADGIFKVTEGIEPFMRDPVQQAKGDLVKNMLSKTRMGNSLFFEDLPVNLLTNEEKCAMHWMLSHSVNLTVRGDENHVNPTPAPHLQERRRRRRRRRDDRYYRPHDSSLQEKSRYPTESGVIRTEYGTVAAGNVLAGLALVDAAPEQLTRRIEEFQPNIRGEALKKQSIDLLHAVTYGVSLAAAGPAAAKQKIMILGPRGWWNCSYCPAQYTLEYEHTAVTDAEIFGGFDGFFLAAGLRGMTDRGNLKLSQALRMYYGKGFQSPRELRACNRLTKMMHWYTRATQVASRNVQNSALEQIAFSMLALENLGSLESAVNRSREVIRWLALNYTTSNFHSMPQCAASQGDSEKVIEPTVDVYVITDASQYYDPISYEEQAVIIGELANHLDIALHASRMGIYINDPRHFDKILPMNKTMSEAELKCRLKRLPIELLQRPSHSQLETIELLHQMFNKIKIDETGLPAAPGKVLLFMQRIRSKNDEKDISWRMQEFSRDHPDVTVLGFGFARASLESYVRVNTDVIPYIAGRPAREIALPIYERIQKIGSSLYFPFCERDFEQYYGQQFTIRPNERRYHTMVSQYFNNSREFRIEILGQGFPLVVCHSRSADIFTKPLSPEHKCEPVPATGSKPVTLLLGDPCVDYKGVFCPEIHLMVESSLPEGMIPVCAGVDCRTADTMRYTINMHDARCGSEAFQISIVLLLISVCVSLLYKIDYTLACRL